MAFVAVSLVAFLFAFVGSMPLAGPISVMVVSRAAHRSYGVAMRLALGAAAAEGIYAALAFWGFATFLARHQIVLPISHGVSAVVLVALGAYFVFWNPDRRGKKDRDKEKKHKNAGFLVGFGISAVNPTLLVTWSAAVAALYSRQLVELTGGLAIPFGAFAAGGVAAWNAVLVEVLKKLGGKLPKIVLVWIVRAMGIILVGVGVWSGVELVLYVLDPAAHQIR